LRVCGGSAVVTRGTIQGFEPEKTAESSYPGVVRPEGQKTGISDTCYVSRKVPSGGSPQKG
jgi:hypothetical protein